MIVKSRAAAPRDGDRILSIVRATSVRHNGKSQGLAAPNPRAQAVLSRTVLEKAGVRPEEIECVFRLCAYVRGGGCLCVL